MDSVWEIVGHIKDLASIITPLAVMVFGIYINNTIQVQNRIAERRSAFTKQWADEFSKLTGEIYDNTLRMLLLYFTASNQEHLVSGDKEAFIQNANAEIPRIALLLEEQKLRLEKYIDLAPVTGDALSQEFDQLHDVVRRWMSSKGGNAETLRKRQTSFNQSARNTHREILALDG